MSNYSCMSFNGLTFLCGNRLSYRLWISSAKFADQQTLWEWWSHVIDDPTLHGIIFWTKKRYFAIWFQNCVFHFVFCEHFLIKCDIRLSCSAHIAHLCLHLNVLMVRSLHSKQCTPGCTLKDMHTSLTIWPWTDRPAFLCLTDWADGETAPGYQITALNFQGWIIELTGRENISGPPTNRGLKTLAALC